MSKKARVPGQCQNPSLASPCGYLQQTMADINNEAGSPTERSELPTPAAVETAAEAKEPPPPDIADLCHVTFQKTGEYLQGELASTVEDYKLLEQMNRATIIKYTEMKQIAVNIHKAMLDLNDKYSSLQPYLDQIDQIEESVASLEQAAYKLDAYSKRLESKFRQLEKQ